MADKEEASNPYFGGLNNKCYLCAMLNIKCYKYGNK